MDFLRAFFVVADHQENRTNDLGYKLIMRRKWCSSNPMSPNLKKCNVLCLKGIAKITIQGHQLENSIVKKDLGIMISNDPTWTAQTERRCEKTMKAFSLSNETLPMGHPGQLERIYTVAILY